MSIDKEESVHWPLVDFVINLTAPISKSKGHLE